VIEPIDNKSDDNQVVYRVYVPFGAGDGRPRTVTVGEYKAFVKDYWLNQSEQVRRQHGGTGRIF
jgi:hypothetical protein